MPISKERGITAVFYLPWHRPAKTGRCAPFATAQVRFQSSLRNKEIEPAKLPTAYVRPSNIMTPIPTHLSAERATVFCAEKEDRRMSLHLSNSLPSLHLTFSSGGFNEYRLRQVVSSFVRITERGVCSPRPIFGSTLCFTLTWLSGYGGSATTHTVPALHRATASCLAR